MHIYIDAANVLHAFMEQISDKVSLNIGNMPWDFFLRVRFFQEPYLVKNKSSLGEKQ